MSAEAGFAETEGDLWFMNSLVNVRRASAGSPDGVSIIEHWMSPSEAPPLHMHHEEDEVFHVIEGRVRFRVGDAEVLAGPGDTLVAPKGVPHAFRVESPEGAHCLTMVRGAAFEGLVRKVSRPAPEHAPPPPGPPPAEAIAALMEAAAGHGVEILGPPMA